MSKTKDSSSNHNSENIFDDSTPPPLEEISHNPLYAIEQVSVYPKIVKNPLHENLPTIEEVKLYSQTRQENPAHRAAKNNNLKYLILAAKHLDELDNKEKEEAKETKNRLHYACMDSSNIEQLKSILSQSTFKHIINNKDLNNETPLHIASKNNNTDAVVALLQFENLEINLKNSLEKTPLHLACDIDNIQIAKLLLEKGADVDAVEKLSQTPLHIAVKKGNHDLVNLLLDNGADIDAKNKLGFTPLHNAIRAEDVGMIKLLLERGSDINIKDLSNETALDLIEKNLKSANPNSAFPEIKSILEEKHKIGASVILKALSIEQLMSTKKTHDAGFGVD